jgi:Domain of unknown function (DUF4160)
MPVRVANGVNEHRADFAGRTVDEVESSMRAVLNIAPASRAYVNGHSVEPTYRLKDGDSLEFVRGGGRKGFAVATFEDLNFVIYPREEHRTPHFHVVYQGESPSFTIADCRRLTKGLERRERDIRKRVADKSRPVR